MAARRVTAKINKRTTFQQGIDQYYKSPLFLLFVWWRKAVGQQVVSPGKRSLGVDDVAVLADCDFDVLFLEDCEEHPEEALQFLAVDGVVAVYVEQVEDVLNVVLSGVLCSDEVGDQLDDLRELGPREAPVVVVVVLPEDLLYQFLRVQGDALPGFHRRSVRLLNIIRFGRQRPQDHLRVSRQARSSTSQRLFFSLGTSASSGLGCSFCSLKSFSSSLMHLAMWAMPFLCCSSLAVCSTLRAISRSSRSSEPSPRYSPEKMVLAKSTAPQCSFGSSLKMFGSLDLGLGTEAVLGTLGIGGGITGMFMPFMPGMVAGQFVGTTLLKSQGMLLEAASLGGGLSFLLFLSFLIFLSFFLSFLGLELERELSETLSLEPLSSEPELYFSFFFFLSSFFLSFFLSFSLCFFLSPINYYKEESHYQYTITFAGRRPNCCPPSMRRAGSAPPPSSP